MFGVNDMTINKKKDTHTAKGSVSGKLNLKRDWQLYVLLLVPLAYFIVFKYIPMGGAVVAFKDYNIFDGILKSKWAGFDVFKQILDMNDFYKALRNTLVLNFLDLIFSFPAPIILALCLNEMRSVKLKRMSQTLLYLPHFMSWVIIGGIAYQLFAANTGVVNKIIVSMGGTSIPFLNNKWYWLVTYLVTGIWQSAGWNTIIYLAAITGVDPNLYEAAEVDGAGRITKILKITLPSIRPTIIVLLIMKIGHMMSIGFERPFVMGNTLVTDFSDVISTFVYRIGLQSGQFNVATAVGLFQSVVGLLLIVVANTIANKFGENGIW